MAAAQRGTGSSADPTQTAHPMASGGDQGVGERRLPTPLQVEHGPEVGNGTMIQGAEDAIALDPLADG